MVSNVRNLILEIQYDGTNYHGWQRQQNAITIQQRLEEGLEKLTKQKVVVTGCGRTDTGVHALCFTCNFYTTSLMPEEKFVRGLNSVLPRDIVALKCSETIERFSALSDCKGKKYRYRIVNSHILSAFEVNYAWHYPYKINIDIMKKAAKLFIGKQDFKTFMASGSDKINTVRNIFDTNIEKQDQEITIEISADGFLYKMVRIICGTLVFVANEKILIEDLPNIIKSKDRQKAGITAPAQGLYLVESYY